METPSFGFSILNQIFANGKWENYSEPKEIFIKKVKYPKTVYRGGTQ